jgi:SAM-dependent MidA family methyltransferase
VTPQISADWIVGEIAAAGPLRFDRYMARALFDPHHGYYASGRAQIGRGGDFYTNVSVGRMFGRVLAAQCAEIWEHLGRPAAFDFVEQGANDGRLAADLLGALREDHPDCSRAVRCTLVEPFPPVAAAQRETLAPFAGQVEWVDSLETLPDFCGLHFTNEYADALPVRLFIRQGSEWLERHVAARNGALCFEDLPAPDVPAILPGDAPESYIAETRPEADAWVTAVASKLQRGVMLVVDYGFPRDQLYTPWRTEGTLSCYRAHRRDDDPLEEPGNKDITAHVDFTALAAAGLASGLQLAGFADQYHFLVGAATPLLLALETAPASPQRESDLRELKTLLHPEMMGTQFKYLALTRGMDMAPALSGFRHARAAAPTLGV